MKEKYKLEGEELEWFEKNVVDEDVDIFLDLLNKSEEEYDFDSLKACIELAAADLKDFEKFFIGAFENKNDLILHWLKEDFGVTKNISLFLDSFYWDRYKAEKEEITLEYEDDCGYIHAFYSGIEPPEKKKENVTVHSLYLDNGVPSIKVFSTREKLEDHLFNFVSDWWLSFDFDKKMGSFKDKDSAIEYYFEHNEDDFYKTEVHKIELEI